MHVYLWHWLYVFDIDYVLYTIGWNFWGMESRPLKILHKTPEKINGVTCSLQLYQISQY